MRFGSFIMTVAHLLTLMGHLSLGNDNINATERAIFLQYLNLAHFELYQSTASLNQALYDFEEIDKAADRGSANLSKQPYSVGVVYVPDLKKRLDFISMEEAIEDDPDISKRGILKKYCLQNNKMVLWPYDPAPRSLVVWYIPQPASFTEQTLAQDIPYPSAYHPVLVDGALYYLFQEEGGFKNAQKAQAAEQRWEIGKSRLVSYLYNTGGGSLSTFSNV